MDRDQIQAWVTAERLSLADFFDDLDEPEWQVESLCSGWNVHQVLAHVSLSSKVSLWETLVGVVKARGDWDGMTDKLARDRADRFTPAELIAQVRESAGSTHRAPGASPIDPLVDMMIHGQDVARPLGRVREMPIEQACAALEHVRNNIFYGSRKRLRGIRLVATDVEWAGGDGPEEIRGPISDLLLVATGRKAGLAALIGPGVQRVTAAM
ncbi:maleylpyruvate isomerase family mycothiol-dependent enzyme [Nocardia sp. XZ_19_369]|uniref:maleylpyruvate isomerase family mycothiol-dependent enzyme n=1 Tax=Nocardia sp. XZ_19_369 TaxID=2769487 RepID=UPI00188F6203|nr:maleylpyruvate isomerase family mycothiol-dependent enzyme [Nocardia sp. XZ_19_369]